MEIKRLTGSQARNYINELASLRIEVFREFPYLYDGSLEYEKEYLERYFSGDGSVVFMVLDGRNAVGASTCMPLKEEITEIQKPFWDKDLDVERYFYFGESVLLKSYRGQGLGKKFFQLREKEALQYTGISYTCFCAVERIDNHPLKPTDYSPLDEFWKRLGYKKDIGLFARLEWKDINEKTESDKKLVFWVRKLEK
jgi:GNAT superfamily N-acetyltransferase